MLSVEKESVPNNNKDIRKDFMKYKEMGKTGLANLGNTCFINSCMQIFSHCYDFNILFMEQEIKNKIYER